jgi:hypothetical protein
MPTASVERDHTGELLSAGPAQRVRLPERPEGAEDNVPSPQQTAAATRRVIERLDAEIAEARVAGDPAEAQRLEVRKARLERKQQDAAAAPEPAEPEPEP